MGYEIDFLPVGNGEKSGDAIALRFGNLYGGRDEQYVVVVDGGYTDSGENIVKHILTHYKTNKVDLVVSTHPDNDHISGLFVVLERLQVGELWIHKPWEHDSEVKSYVSGFPSQIHKAKLQKSLSAACDLVELAEKKRIPIVEPFTGLHFKEGLFVVGPALDFYCQQACRFRGQVAESKVSFGLRLIDIMKRFLEDWFIETLDDSGETSAENESSVLLLLAVDGNVCLLTSDCGQMGLTSMADYLDSISFDWSSISFIQVPHHGSRRNIGPTLLDRIVGPRLSSEQAIKTAFVSCSIDGEPKHPSKRVANAFKRRGAPVHATKGTTKCHFKDAPSRGWSSSTPLPLFGTIEE